MRTKTKQNILKTMGAAFAVCSAAAIAGSSNCSKNAAKNSMKKTADKVVGFVDTIASFM